MKEKDFETSSGNVFADLGLPNPEERLAKATLAIRINELIKEKGLNQKEAAELLGIDQPKISALHKGRLDGFSMARLFKLLNILGQNIVIKITPMLTTKKKPNISVNLQKSRAKIIKDSDKKPRPAMLARKKNKS